MSSPSTPFSRRRMLAGTAGLVAAGGVLAACSSDSSTPAPASSTPAGSSEPTPSSSTAMPASSATLQLSWTHSVQFGGSYIAEDKGFWTAQNLTTTLASGGPNVAGDANTVSGAALMNISGGDGVARSNAQGADLVMIGAQYQKSPGTLLSLATNAIKTPEDLIGARIGVAGVDTPALEAFAKANDLDYSKIILVPSQYDPSVLTADQVDAIFCFYNDLPVALKIQGIEGYSMLLADFNYNPMSQVYTVLRENLANEKRADIIRLLRGDIQGWQEYKKDPKAAAALTVEMFPDAGLDPETQDVQAEVQLDIMYSDLTDEFGFAWFSDEQVTENIALFKSLDIPADESMWDRSILEEIYVDGPTA